VPTKRHRIALTPSDELNATLLRLAEAMDKPVSRTITDLLDELRPQLDGLTKLMQHAKAGNKAGAKKALMNMVGDTLGILLTDQLELPTKRRKS
jgi:predicted transcriptional regulator